MVGYQYFRDPCCLHPCMRGPLKRWYPAIKLHGVTTEKTSTRNITSMKVPKLA